MSAHTPGPWRVNRKGGSQTTVLSDDDLVVATAWSSTYRDAAEANARLIAAAPDMLAALEDALDAITDGVILPDRRDEAIRVIQAAIDKAEGR